MSLFGRALVLLLSPALALAGEMGTTANNEAAQQQQAVSQTSVDTSDRSVNNYPNQRQVGVGVGPALTSSFDACLGSYSAGFGIYGFGVGAGKTYVVESCDRRKDAETAARMGLVPEAKEVMCESVRFFKASVRAGKPCFPDEDMLDELSDSELEWYNSYKDKKVAAVNEQQAFEERVNRKLDNFHRIQQSK